MAGCTMRNTSQYDRKYSDAFSSRPRVSPSIIDYNSSIKAPKENLRFFVFGYRHSSCARSDHVLASCCLVGVAQYGDERNRDVGTHPPK